MEGKAIIMCVVSGHLPGHKFDNLEERVFCRGEGKGEAFEHPQNML
jgi:hypothetical protein